jgi:NTP pyrophosphatase (non-canonical NTP hydrolase)
MQIYLAARYSRRIELCRYREELRYMGHTVQARWLDGEHQISSAGIPIGEHGETLVEGDDGSTSARATALRTKFANDDRDDVLGADLMINFTEPPRSDASRGGRHVECGLALANGSTVIVVGYRENIFHWLEEVRFCGSWEEAKQLTRLPVRRKALHINTIAAMQYDWVERMGWHNKTVLEALALVASEVGEAVNECRGLVPTSKLGTEIADIILRVADLAIWQGIDLSAAIADKMAANEANGTRGRRV